jgi:hypothetical protein
LAIVDLGDPAIEIADPLVKFGLAVGWEHVIVV